jgi:serine/threonine protein kinase
VIDAWKVEFKSIHRVPNGQIGKGCSATVHKVTWLGKDFAEKCFPGPENQVFRKEASLLAGLSHPNILPFFCYATGKNCCSLVMELMDEDLHSLMMRRLGNEETLDAPPFTHLEAVDIMLQVAEGMSYLHQNRVIHRDLKSMNILVKYNERDRHVYAKVADFGLSTIKELSCTYSNLKMDLGTTRWMAPELFGDSEDHNVGPSSSSKSLNYHFKVDVYSFGMVCYEILTGCVPFFNFKLMDLRKRIKDDGLRPDIPERCPKQLTTLVQACYHSNPAIRPSFHKICVELRHIMCSLLVDSTS